jgi:hypothetical protein
VVVVGGSNVACSDCNCVIDFDNTVVGGLVFVVVVVCDD